MDLVYSAVMANTPIVAIIQARMGSTRLPGKILKNVLGKPLLGYLIDRLKGSRHVNKIVIATTDQKQDDPIAVYAKNQNVEVFRGSEDDVLDRYAKAAKQSGAGVVVRITSDCPLIDPSVIDRGVQIFLDNDADYVTNTLTRTYPRGMDVEVFSREALEIAADKAIAKEEREHVTPYIVRHPDLFKQRNFIYSHDNSSLRWTVDTQEDFMLISKLIELVYPENPDFTLEDLLLINQKHPELKLINAHIEQKKL